VAAHDTGRALVPRAALVIARCRAWTAMAGTVAVLAAAAPSTAHGMTLGGEVWGGLPWNLPLPLRIEQSSEAAIRITGRYETRPLERPFYYRVRATVGAGARGEWAIELVHHKLYLLDAPREVQSFSVSHGYKFVLLSRGWDLGPVWVRAGLGPIIAHPESTVRCRVLDEHGGVLGTGYYVAGGAIAAMGERRVTLAGPLYVAVGAMVTAAYARVPIRDGHADVPNVAFHALAGLGVRDG
jgi:hypothetical protein